MNFSSDFFLCEHCFEHLQRKKQQSIDSNVANLKCASCLTPVTKQDINKVLDAAKEAAAACCLGARCQKRGLDCQTEIKCPNKDCFNQLHRECLLSLINSEESISCPLCGLEWRSWIQIIAELMEYKAGEKRKGSHLLGSSPPKKTLVIRPVETVVRDEEPMDTTDEFEVPNILKQRESLCIICKEDDGRKLMPCPAENPNCSNGCCQSCMISAIDKGQRETCCQACYTVTTIKDYSTALGFTNYTLVKRNQPEVDLSAIAAPVFFNDNEDSEQREPPCINNECFLRGSSEEPTIGCRTLGCERIFHRRCLLTVSLPRQGLACSTCEVFYTYSEWVNHIPANANEASSSDSDMD